jgi:hypothetical protein
MNKLKTLLCACALLSLAACQQNEDLPSSVSNRWASLIAQDYETAYGYFSPGYKAVESLESYKLRMAAAKLNVQWKSGAFSSQNCSSEDICQVQVKIKYEYSFPKRSLGGMEVDTEITENWIRTDGKWYLVPNDK